MSRAPSLWNPLIVAEGSVTVRRSRMKTSMTIENLAARVVADRDLIRDYVADTRSVTFGYSADSGHFLDLDGAGRFGVLPHAHDQIADVTSIPRAYYRRMQENAPELLAENVGRWLPESGQRMIRTFGGDVRAVLGKGYRRLDNYDLLQCVLPVLMREKGAEVLSCHVDEKKLYVKAFFPDVSVNLADYIDRSNHSRPKDDIVQAGIVISNSEVGMGALSVEWAMHRLVCHNGMIIPEMGAKRRHVGRGDAGDGESVRELLSDEAMSADDHALWLKVRDIVRASADEVTFAAVCRRLGHTMDDAMPSMTLGVEALVRTHGLRDYEGDGILEHLAKSGDATRFGLIQAVTRYAEDVEDYNRATELERLGGEILNWNESAWGAIARAA